MAGWSIRWLEVFSDGLLVSLEPANGWLVCKMAGSVFRWFASASGTSRWLAGLPDGWKSFPMFASVSGTSGWLAGLSDGWKNKEQPKMSPK